MSYTWPTPEDDRRLEAAIEAAQARRDTFEDEREAALIEAARDDETDIDAQDDLWDRGAYQ